MLRSGELRVFLLLLLCIIILFFSCKRLEKIEREEILSWEELFLFDFSEGGKTSLYNKSSELNDPGIYDFGQYGPHNLFDNDPATCWAEGVSGNGIGEFIFFNVRKGAKRIEFVNGYGKSKGLFEKNNRVKRLKASIYVGIHKLGDATEVGLYFQAVKYKREVSLSLDDVMGTQMIRFPFEWSKLNAFREKVVDEYVKRFAKELKEEKIDKTDLEVIYILWLEIRGVYKGNTYDDTCISDIIVK
jgi:hypothetical protein